MKIDDHILWSERYRPRKVADCILPEDLKKPFLGYVKDGAVPNLILTGTPGTGKTTVARALCEEVGAEYVVINGSDNRGIDSVREVKGFAGSVSLTGGRKVIIVDEADNLTHDAQLALRGIIQEYALGCSFIFTCNQVERIIEPLHSRFAIIKFQIKKKDMRQMAAAFLGRVTDILSKEGITYDKQVVSEVIQRFFPDFRKTLNELQHYAVGGTVDAAILANLGDVSYEEVFSLMKAKNFASLRKWVAHNADGETGYVMRGIYDRLSQHLDPQSVPVAILLLGKYQYQAAFVMDKEINLMAFLTEMMIECQLK